MTRRSFLVAGAGTLFAAVWLGLPPVWGNGPGNLVRRRLSAAELAGDRDILIVDIRTPGEWRETGVLRGALLVTWTDPERFLAAVRPHLRPGQSLALICRSDNRTGRAGRLLAPLIDRTVVDVAGGMLALLAEGHPMVPPPVAR